MAQRDIQEIAEYMKQLNESKIAEDQAYEAACREEEELYAKEDEELEDEVIDPASMGFIDSSTDESDSFYAEEDEEQRDPFSEDVSDCLEQEVVEAEQQATIEVEVYNEDGFGEHFAEEVAKNVPGVDAKVKKTLENGDLVVTLRGGKDDLEKAFAFYLGKKTFAEVSQDDKDSFETILTFDDGDTLAEADYREAVAHCLDPIDVKASTANLVGKDTCTISMVKEEKARRSAKRILKALQEADFSQLPDADLDALDRIKDAIDADARMDDKDRRVWLAVLKDMGYTEEEWNKLTPEQQQKIWDYESTPLPKSNFGDGVHVEVDPKTGKPFRYRNSYEVYDPKTGEKLVTAFNPDYSDEKYLKNMSSSQVSRDYDFNIEIVEVRMNGENMSEKLDAVPSSVSRALRWGTDEFMSDYYADEIIKELINPDYVAFYDFFMKALTEEQKKIDSDVYEMFKEWRDSDDD